MFFVFTIFVCVVNLYDTLVSLVCSVINAYILIITWPSDCETVDSSRIYE